MLTSSNAFFHRGSNVIPNDAECVVFWLQEEHLHNHLVLFCPLQEMMETKTKAAFLRCVCAKRRRAPSSRYAGHIHVVSEIPSKQAHLQVPLPAVLLSFSQTPLNWLGSQSVKRCLTEAQQNCRQWHLQVSLLAGYLTYHMYVTCITWAGSTSPLCTDTAQEGSFCFSFHHFLQRTEQHEMVV